MPIGGIILPLGNNIRTAYKRVEMLLNCHKGHIMKQPIQIGSLHILDLNESELRQIILSYPYPHFIGKQVLKNKNTPLDILLKHTTCSEMLNNSELPKIVNEKILNFKKEFK